MAIEDPNEQQRVLARKAREKAALQARMRPIAQAVDHEGQVTVYETASRQHVRLWPVDAAELIAAGKGFLKGSEPVPETAAAPAPDQPKPAPAEPLPSALPVGGEQILPPKGTKGKGKTAGTKPEIPTVPDSSPPV